MQNVRLCLLAMIAVLMVGSWGLAQEPAKTTQQPNIVMIISDDQGWMDYSFMGHPTIETPNLDKLAKQSALFRRGYVPTALCRPSLMTMITGRYAHQHGVTGNDPSPKFSKRGTEDNDRRRAELITNIGKYPTIAKQLAEHGYRCHQSGKWWEGNFKQGGFTEGMTRGFPEPGGRHGDDGLKIGREGIEPVTKFIDSAVADEKPFFVWYAPYLPHFPHTPPERLFEKYSAKVESKSIAKYYAMCDWFDETCGQLINHLDEQNLRDNTLIVYVCDNGWIQNPTSRGYLPRSKQTPYEGGIRTPILFCWPGKIDPSDRPELCSSIDLAPTILAAAGIKADADLPGLNLLPYLEDKTPIDRDTLFGETFAHDIADINKPEASLMYRWCIQGKWKLLLTYDGEAYTNRAKFPRTDKRPQLFDLIADPGETKNLASENPTVVAELAQKIKQWYPLTERKTVEVWSDEAVGSK
ncbi:sulfatase [Mariniblastus sp.]|nr:sulfatase [Mariniblastus sp.]